MPDLLLLGPLAQGPVLAAILGTLPAMTPFTLPDHGLILPEGQLIPHLTPKAGAVAQGVLLPSPSADAYDRLDFYASGFGVTAQPLTLPDGTKVQVLAHLGAAEGPLWAESPLDAVVLHATRDLMALYGAPLADRAHARYPMMLGRAASRLRAMVQTASHLRDPCGPRDVQVTHLRQTYANYFAVEEYDLRHRRFDGTLSEEINRAVFVSGDAATVLPYDPVRDRVLVVEQFRSGPFARGDANPWLIECVAGRIDPFELPEVCARREAQEEAGVELDQLIEVARYYPSPAAKTEFIYSYVALCDLPDRPPLIAGLEGEGEDIRSHLISFAELMSLISGPEGANAPLILSAQWLAANREALRAAR